MKKEMLVIGMPVFNGQDFIENAIKSILNQSYEDFILIISDNYSTDSTKLICENLAKNDNRIKYIRRDANYGSHDNFNYVFSLARNAKYFMWAAHDDLWEKDWVKVLLNKSINNQCLSYGKCVLINENGAIINSQNKLMAYNNWRILRRIKYFLTPPSYGKSNPMYGIFPVYLYNKKWFEGKDILNYGGDTILVYRMLSRMNILINRNVVHYKRVHLNSVGSEMPSWYNNKSKLNSFKYLFYQTYLFRYMRSSVNIEKLFLIALTPILLLRIVFLKAQYLIK